MNPYSYSNPNIIRKSLTLLKNIKWGTFLDGTQKTLGVINQAIPIVYQVKPLIGNAKTLLKIANEVSNTDSSNNKKQNQTQKHELNNSSSPIFYID